MLRTRLSKSASRFIATRVPKHQRQIQVKIRELSSDPMPPDTKAVKGSQEPCSRVDVGEYRIIYRVTDDVLEILLVGKRNDDEVYREFGRR